MATVLSPFNSNKNGLIVVFTVMKRTYYSLQKYKKKKQKKNTYYFSFFLLYVGFLVEFICQTQEKTKFESKMQKMKKKNPQFFKIWTYHTFEFH